MKNDVTIVILHGWGQDSTSWTKFIDIAQAKYDVIAIDLPGFGKEPLVSETWSIPEYANWVEKQINQKKLTNVILIGHSFGGRIGAYIAADNPKWLKKLVLYAAPVIYRPSIPVQIKKWVAPKLKKLKFGFLRKLFGNKELMDADKNGLGKIFRTVVTFDQTDTAKKIKTPVTLIWGKNDKVVPLRIAHELVDLIPASTLEVVPFGDHNVHLHNPHLFYGLVKKFIESD